MLILLPFIIVGFLTILISNNIYVGARTWEIERKRAEDEARRIQEEYRLKQISLEEAKKQLEATQKTGPGRKYTAVELQHIQEAITDPDIKEAVAPIIAAQQAPRETITRPATEGEQRLVRGRKLTERQRERQARIAATLRKMGKKVDIIGGDIISEENGRKVIITPETYAKVPPSAIVDVKELEREVEKQRQRTYQEAVKKEEKEYLERPELPLPPVTILAIKKAKEIEEERISAMSEAERVHYERYKAIGTDVETKRRLEQLKEVGIGAGLATYSYFKGLKELMTPIFVSDPMEFPEKAREKISKPEVQTFLIGTATSLLPRPLLTAGGVVVTGLTAKEYIEEPSPRKLGELIFYAGVTTLLITDLVKSRYKAQTKKLSPDKQKRLDEYLKLAQKVEAKSHRNLEPSTIEALRHVKNSKGLNKALNDYFVKNPDIVSGGTYGQRTTLKGKAYTGARLPQDGDLYVDVAKQKMHTKNIMNIIRRFTDRKVFVKADGTIMVQNPVGESNAFSFHSLSVLKNKIKVRHPIKGEFWKHYGVVETPDGTKVLNPKYQAEFKISGAMYQRYQTLSKQVKKGKVSKEFMQKKIVQDYADFKAILDSSSITSTVYDRLGKRGAYYGGIIDYKYRPSGIPFIYSFLARDRYPRPTKYPAYPRPTPYPTFITPAKYPTPTPPTKYPTPITYVTPTYPKYAEPTYPKFIETVTVYPAAEEYPKVKYPAPKELPIFITPAKYPVEEPTPALITKVREIKEKREPRFITPPQKKEGFDVMVREGERRQDRFKRVAKNLPRHKALRRGRDITDQYIEATYRIKSSGKTTEVADDLTAPDLSKFRSPKPKSKLPRDSLIELAKHRLDSAKEIQQISYFKELAARKKQLQQQISFIKAEKKQKKIRELRGRVAEQINFLKSSSSSKQEGVISFISSSKEKKKKSKRIKFL